MCYDFTMYYLHAKDTNKKIQKTYNTDIKRPDYRYKFLVVIVSCYIPSISGMSGSTDACFTRMSTMSLQRCSQA